jgi:WD40 repeat protein
MRARSTFAALRGYDFFVSYTRRDARDYATRLANRLRERFDVFFDEDELEAGERIAELEAIVQRSTVLVVVVSPRIAESVYVPREVAAAERRQRRIIAIDVEGTMAQSRAGSALQPVLERFSFLQETQPLGIGPSSEVGERIAGSLRALRRRTKRAALTMAVAASMVALVATVWILMREGSHQRQVAEERAYQARRTSYARHLEIARSLIERDPVRAASVLADAAACPEDLREMAWAHLVVASERLRWSAPDLAGAQVGARWLSENELVTVGKDGYVRSWDVNANRVKVRFATKPGTRLLDVEPGRRYLALQQPGQGIELRDGSGAQITVARSSTSFNKARFIARGARLVAFGANPAVVFNVSDLREDAEQSARVRRVTEEGHEDALSGLVAVLESRGQPESLLFLVNTEVEEYVESSVRTVDDHGRVLKLDVSVGTHLAAGAISESGRVCLLARHEDRATALGHVGFIRFANLAALNALGRSPGIGEDRGLFARYALPNQSATAIAIDRAGHGLYVGTAAGLLRRRDLDRGTTMDIELGGQAATAVELSPADSAVATIDAEGDVRVWEVGPRAVDVKPSLDLVSSTLSHKLRVLFRTPGGHVVYAYQSDKSDGGNGLHVLSPGDPSWKSASFNSDLVRSVPLDEESLGSMRSRMATPVFGVSPDGRSVVFLDSGLKGEWLQGDRDRDHPPGPAWGAPTARDTEAVRSMAAAPSGDLLAIAWAPSDGSDAVPATYRLELWRRGSDEVVRVLDPAVAPPAQLVWSPGGGWIAGAFGAGEVRVWNARDSASAPWCLGGAPERRPGPLAFSADDRWLIGLTYASDGSTSLRWFDMEKRTALHERVFPHARATRLAVRSNGEGVAVGFADGHVALFDRRSERWREFAGDTGTSIAALEYSTDGRTLLRVSQNRQGFGATALCDGQTGQPLLDLEVQGVPMDVATFLPDEGGVVAIGADDRVYTFRARGSPSRSSQKK